MIGVKEDALTNSLERVWAPQTCSSLSADVRFGKEKGAEEQEEQERLGRTGGHPG